MERYYPRGFFCTFEGGEGSGKTSQIIRIYEWLTSLKYDCILTREPGGTEIGRSIRTILLSNSNNKILPLTELLLYGGDRSQHIGEVITPALKKGKIVLSDRYTDSTTVYQGYAKGLDINLIKKINHIATGGLKPDLTILLDLPVEIGLKRATKRNEIEGKEDQARFEKEAINFHKKIREGYLELSKKESERFVVINAEPNLEIIHEEVKKTLAERLNLNVHYNNP